MSGLVELEKEILEKSESPPETGSSNENTPEDETGEIKSDENTSDIEAADAKQDSDSDGKVETLSDGAQESSEVDTDTDKSRKSSSLEKNGWTMVEKEDVNKDSEEAVDKDAGETSVRDNETDSESIETISDEEPLIRSYISCATNSYIQEGFPSFGSQVSTISSVNSDGIPIRESLESSNYIWSKEGEQAVPEARDEVPAHRDEEQSDDAHREDEEEEGREDQEEEDQEVEAIEESDDENVVEPVAVVDEDGLRLQQSQEGVDEEDDGLRLNFFARLLSDLYPSEELSEDFAGIQRGEVYKHNKNFQLNSMLTAAVILVVALAIGLGIGHFLGMSEKLEYVEMYDEIQDGKIDHLQDELVTCISGEEGKGGDDQDLDDRVIRSLWVENQELRDQIQNLKLSLGDPTDAGDEAMSAVLRDRINSLLTANADLEREVARLRYAEAARGAAESQATLEKLRSTKDALNSIVDENDQLKIQIGKTRYSKEQNQAGGQEHMISTSDADALGDANDALFGAHDALDGDTIAPSDADNQSPTDVTYQDMEMDFDECYETQTEEESEDQNQAETADRSEEQTVEDKQKEYKKKDHKKKSDRKRDDDSSEVDDDDHDDDDDDDDYEHPVLKEFSRKLSKSLSKIGARVYNRKGNINWEETSRFFTGLQADMVSQLSGLGILSEDDLNIFSQKFSDLKKFVNSDVVSQNFHASKKTSEKLLQSLIKGVKELQDAAEDAAEHSGWSSLLKRSVKKVKNKIDDSWKNIKKTFKSIVSRNKYDDGKHKDNKDYNNNRKRGQHDDDDAWDIKRGKHREDTRKQEQKGEWMFDRSKEREHQRKEDRRGDWYNDRKNRRQRGEEDDSDDEGEECRGPHCKKRAKYHSGEIRS